jgi:N-acetylglutamate synthase-like GNAT family acetyltransferase
VNVRPAKTEDRDVVAAFLEARGSARVARRRELVDAREHPALVAEEEGRFAGVLTYVLDGPGRLCEVLTLHAAERGRGVGTALLANLERIAKAANIHRVWLITTNDNLDALRFYQRRGFRLAAVYPDAVGRSRASLKPEIPEVGEFGIPLRDEIELWKEL